MKLFRKKACASANDLFRLYAYREAYEKGIMNTDANNENSSINWNIVKSELLLKLNSLKEFNSISSKLFKNPWLDLYISLSSKYREQYKLHFEENREFYWKLLNTTFIDVMLSTNSTDENDYINYTEQDITQIPKSRNQVSRFWICRSYYLALKHVWPSFASEVFSSSQIEYSKYINNDKKTMSQIDNNYSDVFMKLTTTTGKRQFIDKFWHKVKVDGNSINYSPLIEYKECLLIILDECLKVDDEICIDNIITILYAIFALKDNPSEINELKSNFIKIVENYNVK